ncbi:hypothetical protein M569_02631, partial [Genlisea aurea]
VRLRAILFSGDLWNFSSINAKPRRPRCAKPPPPPPPQKDDSDDTGKKYPRDWDRAWSSFRKQGKKAFFSDFSPDKYVSWNPRRSEFPLSEEIDPIKRSERSNLMLWTSTRFTLGLAIVIITLLILYTLSIPLK